MTNAFSWQNFLSLPLLHSVLQSQTCLLLQVSFDFVLLHSSPLWWKGHFHRTIQLQLLQHWWLGHRLGLLWYWMVFLGNELISFCHFWDCTQVLHFRLFVDYEGYSISSKGFLPTVVDIMVTWIKLPIPVHFSSLIPEMSVFTLAISCLTTSSLPWFMDLIFQVPIQYCSLQYQVLLPSPVTSTIGHCFRFGSISSFFLELFL